MIRISKLLRAVKLTNKIPVRGGPGWDRPDVPPSQTVQTNKRWTHEQIIYTFFDSSMPEFFITEPEIYEGDLYEGLPQLFSMWGVFLGTAFTIYLYINLINPPRQHRINEPFYTEYFLNQVKRLNEEKVGLKWARENPFGITINSEQFPYYNSGVYWYPPLYHSLKAQYEQTKLIQSQAREYLKKALDRASASQTSQNAHH